MESVLDASSKTFAVNISMLDYHARNHCYKVSRVMKNSFSSTFSRRKCEALMDDFYNVNRNDLFPSIGCKCAQINDLEDNNSTWNATALLLAEPSSPYLSRNMDTHLVARSLTELTETCSFVNTLDTYHDDALDILIVPAAIRCQEADEVPELDLKWKRMKTDDNFNEGGDSLRL